jgi:signal transduction histidine kinase
LDEVQKSNRRVTDLVQAIVNVSRTDLSRLKHKHEPVNVKTVIEKLHNDATTMATQKSISIDLDINDGNYEFSDSDFELVSVVLRNILTNAVRYTQDGGHIRISLREVVQNEVIDEVRNARAQCRGALFCIADNGIGIPDEEQESVFNKLFRATNVQALDVTGVGLGLYVAHGFVVELGGQIWFKSKLREGTEFYIFIPESHTV